MKVDVAGIAVFIAMPVFSDIPPPTVASLLATQEACLRRGIPLEIQFGIGSTVFHARSKGAFRFLRSAALRLFMIDSDMVWTAEDFLRMVALSTKMECVCATYTSRTEPPVFFLNTLEDGAPMLANEYGCIPIGGAGLGFTIVTRCVIQQLSDQAGALKHLEIPEPVPKVFRFDETDGIARGEDMAFFADVRKLGYAVHLDPTISLGHVGAKTYTAPISDLLCKA